MSSNLGLLIEPKLLKLVQLFLKNKEELYTLDLISKTTKVPIGSTFRLMKKLVDTGIVDVITVGKTKLYKTNKKKAKEFGVLSK